jgi:hypothetical protein
MHVAHLRQEEMLFLDHQVQNVIEGRWGRRSSFRGSCAWGRIG